MQPSPSGGEPGFAFAWNDQKAQDALQSCPRNTESSEVILKVVTDRDHSGSAMECRTKGNALPLEYKQRFGHQATSVVATQGGTGHTSLAGFCC